MLLDSQMESAVRGRSLALLSLCGISVWRSRTADDGHVGGEGGRAAGASRCEIGVKFPAMRGHAASSRQRRRLNSD